MYYNVKMKNKVKIQYRQQNNTTITINQKHGINKPMTSKK